MAFWFVSCFHFNLLLLKYWPGLCVTHILRKLSLVFNPADIKAKDQV